MQIRALVLALFLAAPVPPPVRTVTNGPHDLTNVVVAAPVKDLDPKGSYTVTGTPAWRNRDSSRHVVQ